jgi:hypothetical protein
MFPVTAMQLEHVLHGEEKTVELPVELEGWEEDAVVIFVDDIVVFCVVLAEAVVSGVAVVVLVVSGDVVTGFVVVVVVELGVDAH